MSADMVGRNDEARSMSKMSDEEMRTRGEDKKIDDYHARQLRQKAVHMGVHAHGRCTLWITLTILRHYVDMV
jgi:hypothetical protein